MKQGKWCRRRERQVAGQVEAAEDDAVASEDAAERAGIGAGLSTNISRALALGADANLKLGAIKPRICEQPQCTVDSLTTENAWAHENRDFGRFSDFKLARTYVSGG
jgi:hypothetical protein